MFDFLYNPQGRISRKGYLVAYLPSWLVCTQLFASLFGGLPGASALNFALSVFFFWPGMVVVPVKRFHDLGISGWYHFGVLVLIFVAFMIISQGLAPSIISLGDNPVEVVSRMTLADQRQWMSDVITDSPRAQLGIFLLGAVILAEFILIASVRGKSGPNRYGNDPLISGRGFAD